MKVTFKAADIRSIELGIMEVSLRDVRNPKCKKVKIKTRE